jgi:hypothetical protein
LTTLLALGPTARGTIYYYVEKKFQLKREEFCNKVGLFHEALKSILGEGTKILENSIAGNLYNEIGLKFDKDENSTLVDYVQDAKRRLETG